MKMQYKNFVWPNNPTSYTLKCEHLTAIHKLPLGTFCVQDLGKTATVMRGEGEFYGPDAYRNYCELERIFAESGSGTLLHPVWSGHNVFFTKLTLNQEPRADYAAYSFEFCEEGTSAELISQIPQDGVLRHTVSAGETAWSICEKFHLTMEAFLKLNPQIAHINALTVGEEVRVS